MAIKILRLTEVIERTGLSRSTIYLRVSKGEFPSPISLGGRSIGFLEDEYDDWVAQQVEKSRDTKEGI